MARPRVILIADGSRPDVAETSGQVRQTISRYAEVVGELSPKVRDLPADLQFDMAVVVGGDGTLIRQARRLADRDIPLVGVNVGRLGFLAEFDTETLAEHAAMIFGGEPRIRELILLKTTVRNRQSNITHEDVAVNDCVIGNGPPFRMVELRITINGADGPQVTGDGLIIATPTGSTAYNVSAGGPIVHPALAGMVITPLAAHSLAFRPIVLPADCVLRVEMLRANEGTALVLDGQEGVPLKAGDTVEIRQDEKKARFVINVATTYWGILLDKMRWAAPPSYRDRGR